MLATAEIMVADEAWVALALLHRRHPERESFTAAEIMESAKREKAHPGVRPGLQPHIYLHNVANTAPNSARYRLFYKVSGGGYRLFRLGDDVHPQRKGKTAPHREDLPAPYIPLLDWYEKEYACRARPANDEDDPVLQMWGIGKELWKEESGDAFIARERAGLDREMEIEHAVESSFDTLRDRVWKRIDALQGAEFRTAKNLPFTYSIEGNGLWFYRNGKRIPMFLGRKQVDSAIARCPLKKTTELKDLRDYAYLFGLLMDRRIRSTDW